MVPGAFETLTVEFTPTEWRYYYDCIRVHASDGTSLLVPIHGYPIMNDVVFPKRLDFGICELNEVVEKRLPLKCNVPIDFEFRVRVLEPHAYFTVEPLEGTLEKKFEDVRIYVGIVPGNGQVDICIRFTPRSMRTAICRIQIDLAQFGFTPFVCELLGSCQPSDPNEIELYDISKYYLIYLVGAKRKM